MSLSPTSRDAVLIWTLRACAAIAGVTTLLIAYFVFAESLPALRDVGIGRFFSDTSWHPKEFADQGTFLLAPMIAGTLIVVACAVALATPAGIGIAIFCHFYAPPAVAKAYRAGIGLLAGIPSVVFGFWGLVVLVPIINSLSPPGQSVLAASLVLALMVLPTVALTADAAIAAVPRPLHHAAAALGLSRWATLSGVVVPAARRGIFTGVILQVGRAVGETLAVLMVAGNIPEVPHSIFEPARTLTANIALEMAYATGDHRSALFVSGLMLLILVTALVAAAELIKKSSRDAATH